MNRLRNSLLIGALACVLGMAGSCYAQGIGLPGVTLGFRNDTKSAIIVQGATKLHNQIRRGQPVIIAPGRIGYDVNVPHGIRFITIYDATQPSRILLVNFPLAIQHRATFSVSHGAGGQTLLTPISVP
jgi:hypothetical protein